MLNMLGEVAKGAGVVGISRVLSGHSITRITERTVLRGT